MDSYRHKGLRKKLIETLLNEGITDQKVLQAMSEVPRHLYLDGAFEDWAYKNQAFQIGCGQTISQPYTVAFQTQLLDVQATDKILEIGTGSGYQASVLSLLAKRVYTIERQKTLFDKTTQLLSNIGFGKIRTLYGDGYAGSPRFAPFDKIIVTAGAINIPQTLIDQLRPGGKMVIPVGTDENKTMIRINKDSDSNLHQEEFGVFHFVPFKEGTVST